MAGHDWSTMASFLAEGVVRTGPYGDVYRGRDEYVAFISLLLPTLPGYSMDVSRVTWDPEARVAVAELSETVTVDGAPLVTPEALVFELDGDGRIAVLTVFTSQA